MIEIFAISWKWGLHQTIFWNFPKSNLWIYNIFLTIQLLFYAGFYYRLITADKIKKAIRYGILPLAGFGIFNFFYIQSPGVLNSYSIIPYYFTFVIFALVFFHQVLHDKQIIVLHSHPAIWISLGTFIYYSVSLPFCIFLPYLVSHNPALAFSLFKINMAFDTLMYSFYLISFLCKPQFLKSAY
ncbi:hypothetical protein SAMN05428947_102621 [Mucilaginibacter sp. OK283]|jgi:hypothetical protein|nr:hypothetical protein SAMN05428947_102621 [Mucilaginibacter sp. OK283]